MDFVEVDEVCHFRSRLNELPIQLKRDIALVTLQDGWNNMKRRNEIIKMLTDYKIDFVNVGTGTNRFIVRYDSYALKIALDNEGVNDNKQEWNVSTSLSPDIAMPYEISKGGHLMVAAYAPAFTTFQEMNQYSSKISKILEKWSNAGYLLGDVGIQHKNFANWGLLNGNPVCIDYAYIFKASGAIFGCSRCGYPSLVIDNITYADYSCPKCKYKFPDALIRARIPGSVRALAFDDSVNNDSVIEMTDTDVDVNCTVKKPIEYNPDSPRPIEGYWNAYMKFLGRG